LNGALQTYPRLEVGLEEVDGLIVAGVGNSSDHHDAGERIDIEEPNDIRIHCLYSLGKALRTYNQAVITFA
jgi:hypothetical protein